MPPKLKKQPKNSYFFFIMEMKKQREAEGYRIGSFQNAQLTFGHMWSPLSKEERAPYEQMAKEAKEEEKYNVNNKFTVTGESYAQVHKKARDQQTSQDITKGFIERLSTGSQAGDRMYIFMKVLHSTEEIVDRKRRVYWPNEMSMVAFSLKGGVKSIYTQKVDTVAPPTGYASQAKDLCEETMMPLPGSAAFTEDSRDYLRILKNINGFANHWLKDGYDVSGHRRVFFALDKEIYPISSSIQWLVNQLDGKDKPKYQKFANKLKIYSLPKLVLAMAEECNRVNSRYNNYLVDYKLESAAEDVITKGNYDYREEIACPYHRTEASLKIDKCAQSIVMRRVYMLFEEFANDKAYGFPASDRHKIDKLSKKIVRGPAVKKKREESPKVVEKVGEVPEWMKVGDNVDLNSGSSPAEAEPYDKGASAVASWGQQSPPAASFNDNEFPTLGSGINPPKPSWGSLVGSSSPLPTGAGRGRGGGGGGGSVSSASIGSASFMDDEDDYPTLEASSKGRGRGRY